MRFRYLFLAVGLLLTTLPLRAQPGLLAVQNPAGTANDGIVRLSSTGLVQTARFNGVGGFLSIQSAAIGPDGTAYVTYDTRNGATTGGGLLRLSGVATQADSARIAGGESRVSGSNTTLVAPKGVEVAMVGPGDGGAAQMLVIVSDNGAGSIVFFAPSAMGNTAPVFTITNLGMTAAGARRTPWDTFYDPAADRLFVAGTDGVVVVLDNVSVRRGATTPTAFMTPTLSGTKVTVNLHGIQVIPNMSGVGQTILLSDVGSAASATDGAILAIPFAPGMGGATPQTLSVPVLFINRGAATRLGNPVDLVYNGLSLFVAEKSNSEIQRYDNLLAQTGDVSVAPTASRAVANPESVALTPQGAVVAASNPGDVAQDRLVRLDPMSLATQAFFNGFGLVTDLQSITLNASNGAYVTFDRPDGTGGILYTMNLGTRMSDGVIGEGDVVIAGPMTGLRAPKGILAVDNAGLLFVANNGAQNVLAFRLGAGGTLASNAGGNVAPAFTLDLGMTAGGARRAPWDIDYEPFRDRLYVAGTDGVVAVFDNVSALGATARPSRFITPTDAAGNKISVNLHGIVYVAAQDVLILSDVGSAASATDGQLFVIPNASTASGNVAVRYRNSGANTALGNPVDLAFFNGTLFVAEKSNNAVQRYDNFLAASGTFNVAPTSSVTVTAPESIALTRGATGIAGTSAQRAGDGLGRVYPNPARGAATLTFALPETGAARVAVYDAMGRQVALVHEGVLSAGDHTRTWRTDGLASGLYIVRLDARGATSTQTVTVLR